MTSQNSILLDQIDNWNGALRNACRGGHMDIVKLLIEKGANDWCGAILNASEGDHMDIVNLLIKKAVKTENFEWCIELGSRIK